MLKIHKTTDKKKNPYTLVLSFNIIPSNKNSTRLNTCTVDLKIDATQPTNKIIDKNNQTKTFFHVTRINDGTDCGTTCTDTNELFKVQNYKDIQ